MRSAGLNQGAIALLALSLQGRKEGGLDALGDQARDRAAVASDVAHQ